MTTQTYPSLQQDSVRTYIVGSKSVTTFYVYAPYSSDYILRFWLMGVKHSDGNYSSYVFRIDQDINTQQVKTTRGDWASRSFKRILNNCKFKKGLQNISVPLPSPGIYSIGLVANGCVYKKKICVK